MTSRDQGLEAFRSWLGPALMTGRGIKDISVGPLSDGEAEELAAKVPRIHGLLFGNDKVREIARRPFFASILANHVNSTELNSSTYPSTESELIQLWWRGGGFDVDEGERFKRQRALIDLAECGAQSLGKKIPANSLQLGTVEQVSHLVSDPVSYTHLTLPTIYSV